VIKENQRLVRARDTDDTLTCIVCPIGCRMSVEWSKDGELTVTGNRCKRGAAYAEEEFRDPRRVVTGTCAISGAFSPRLPVRSSNGVPIDQLAAFLKSMYDLRLSAPIACGDVVAQDLGGTGIDLLATMTARAEGENE
jgi:CxxC motif-containing protein